MKKAYYAARIGGIAPPQKAPASVFAATDRLARVQAAQRADLEARAPLLPGFESGPAESSPREDEPC